MEGIIYFTSGQNGRFINNGYGHKTIIGNHITKEGYYIGKTVEKKTCLIFYGIPYTPSEEEIPVPVQFNPNEHRAYIKQDSIEYFLVRHKQGGGYFVICQYQLLEHGYCSNIYFSDLLTFKDGKWQMLKFPFEAIKWNTDSKINEYWHKYGNYYGDDFEIIKKL